ncbi:MAG: Bcr/CflA family efflux MFS transporter [Propionicimonas sp.]|uniref:Bcr/CflA family efflux MFS transporter n=1 Tax=Propionicimonas sp. TaxID=1955623 RepID=UPI003D139A88
MTGGPSDGGGTTSPAMSVRVMLLLAVLTALSPLSMDIYTPSLPVIQSELGGAEWATQASITACLLGIGVGQLVWGPLSDRLGRRPVILAGVAGWTLASVASALVTTPWALIGARGFAGLAGAAGIVAARSVVRDLSGDSRAVATRIGVLAIATALAPILSPVVGTLIAGLWGWRADFWALALLGVAIMAGFAVTVPETLPPGARTARGASLAGALGLALRDREVLGVSLALGLHSIGFYAYIATASFIVEREFGYPPAVFALVFGTNACAILLTNVLFRRVVRTRHPSLPLGIGLVTCTAAGVLLLVLAASGAPAVLVWATSTLYAAGVGFVLPGAHSWGQLTLVASGAASALTGSLQFLGGVIGSPLTGVIGTTAFHLGGVIAVGSGLGILAWTLARRHHSAPA